MNNFFEDNLFFSVTSLARELSVIAESHFSTISLTPSDALLMLVVSGKAGVQPTEISLKIKLAPSTITRMVEKLEKKNLLVRSSESKYTYIHATEKGQQLFPAIIEIWLNVYAHFNNYLDAETIEKLIAQTSNVSKRISS